MKRGIVKNLVALTLALFATAGWGQSVFLKYGPVAGIQKSTGATYQNTAAGASDINAAYGSQTANTVLAAPNGAPGTPGFRALVLADVPPINLATTTNGGVLSTSILAGTNGGTSNGFMSFTGPTTSLKTFTLPNASANILTDNAAVTVAQGGTSLQTLTAHGVLLGEGTSAVSPLVMGADTVLRGTASADPVATSVPNCGSSANALSYSTTTHTFGCQAITGSGTPGGANTNVQFNSSGVLGGDSSFTYAGAGGAVTAPTLAVTSSTVPVNGLYLPAANTLGIATNTTARVAIGSTGDIGYGNSSQNVATLGTNIPTFQLNGGNTARTGGLRGRSSDNSVDWAIYGDSGGGGLNIGTITNNVVSFQKNNATVMQFSSAAAGRQVDIVGTTGTSSAVAYAGFVDTAGVRYGYFGKSSSGSQVSYESDADVALISGNGAHTLISTSAGALTYDGVSFAPQESTFTMTYNGFSAGCSLTARYVRIGNFVQLLIPGSAVCASNATTFTATGLPSPIQVATAQQLGMFEALCEDNSTIGGFTCGANVSGSTITFTKNNSSSGWTASGQKGITTNMVVTYFVN